jgi:sigma-B regulation protein RsbU (phosphoserine phosphatase)
VETIDAFTNEFEALKAAMISETVQREIYARYAEEASSGEMKQLFSRLAEYKAMHLQSMEDELKALSITRDGGSNGSSTDALSVAIDEGAGMDMARCQFTLSITENQLKSLESANQELLQKQLRHEQELAIAADIQKKLLPQEFPQGMGIQIAASSVMAKVVGGDYYDMTTNQNGQLSLIVADSMGKGIPAALLMTTIRAIWRGCSATCCRSPGQVLETINRAMYQDLRATESFITMFGAIYDPETSIFRYSSAGHSPAIFCQASETEDRMLDMGGLPVGILPDSDFPGDQVLMREGDIIVMYTDGVAEAANENGDLFGVECLCNIIEQHRSSDAEVIKDAILSELDSHTNGSPLADDTTLVVLKKA